MEKHILSKTSYIRGLQCSKSLFLYRFYPQKRDPVSPERQAQFNRGNDIGLRARDLFPGGVDATAGLTKRFEEAPDRTQELMKNPEIPAIYEAAFRFEGILIFVDILERHGNSWRAYEVKSSLRVSHVHYNDAALQYFVLHHCGIAVESFSLIHIDGYYVRRGAVNLQQLFKQVPVTEHCVKQLVEIAARIADMKTVLASPQVPERAIGDHCFQPYTCDFMGQCWKPFGENSIFNLTGLSRTDAFLLYQSGIETIGDISDVSALNEMARMQVAAYKSGEPQVDKPRLREFIDGLKYPLLYFDIELFMPAVPMYDGTKPYQHLPFQFSIHRQEIPGGELRHIEFIAEPGSDPRPEFLNQLLRETEGEGTLLIYDVTLEKNILLALKNMFPEKGEAINQRIARMRDLMQPFMERTYHHPRMKGSVSLKNVLPALVPGMSYDELKVANGSQAMTVYEQMHQAADLFSAAEMREALSTYGKLDTLSMARILDVLQEAVKE